MVVVFNRKFDRGNTRPGKTRVRRRIKAGKLEPRPMGLAAISRVCFRIYSMQTLNVKSLSQTSPRVFKRFPLAVVCVGRSGHEISCRAPSVLRAQHCLPLCMQTAADPVGVYCTCHASIHVLLTNSRLFCCVLSTQSTIHSCSDRGRGNKYLPCTVASKTLENTVPSNK